jgi:hypothetical protein
MPAPRLNDSQKQELVDRYRQGETAQALAAAYGCSPNTVSRVLKAALDPAEMEAIKRQSRRGSAAPVAIPEPVAAPSPQSSAGSDDVAVEVEAGSDEETEEQAEPRELAIDDADDFGDDGLDDADPETDADGDSADFEQAAAIAAAAEAQPLAPGVLPTSVYMLVDKTVELQARPLRDFPELGSLPEDEQERQALMLYTNPRQAKRQCGRTQRVIKVPDAGVLERRSSYLVAKGITRLVLEGGALYAL